MDTVTPPIRSRLMANIRSKDTRPERAVRSILHALGYRFRLHRTDLPGKPDIVLPRHKKVVLVHGCFWHQHPGCALASHPSSNVEYWSPKLAGNVERDKQNLEKLVQLGWNVLIVWECQTRKRPHLDRILLDFMING